MKIAVVGRRAQHHVEPRGRVRLPRAAHREPPPRGPERLARDHTTVAAARLSLEEPAGGTSSLKTGFAQLLDQNQGASSSLNHQFTSLNFIRLTSKLSIIQKIKKINIQHHHHTNQFKNQIHQNLHHQKIIIIKYNSNPPRAGEAADVWWVRLL